MKNISEVEIDSLDCGSVGESIEGISGTRFKISDQRYDVVNGRLV
jgi:hypothetical protein